MSHRPKANPQDQRSQAARSLDRKTFRLKLMVWILGLMPLAMLVGFAFTEEGLGANPVETITHHTGEWALRLLLVTLTITPLRKLTGWHLLARTRRLWGLFSFFYLSLHFTTYAVLDAGFDISYVFDDVAKRPYITAGFIALCTLIPLALTSTDGMIRRLGGRRWRQLHRLAYVGALGGVLHFLWLVKVDWREPVIYALWLIIVLALRVPRVPPSRWRSALQSPNYPNWISHLFPGLRP